MPALCTAHKSCACCTHHTGHTTCTCTIHTAYICASYTYMIHLHAPHILIYHTYISYHTLTCTYYIILMCYTDPHAYNAWKPIHMGHTYTSGQYTFVFRIPTGTPSPHLTTPGMAVARFWRCLDKENKAILSHPPPA